MNPIARFIKQQFWKCNATKVKLRKNDQFTLLNWSVVSNNRLILLLRGLRHKRPVGNLVLRAAGVLLRRLLSDPGLQGTTHVVVDEVHERSVDSDLLLLLLRDLLASGANGKLRVVLMSATAEAGLFQRYFGEALLQASDALVRPLAAF